jgi:hypothetical protein
VKGGRKYGTGQKVYHTLYHQSDQTDVASPQSAVAKKDKGVVAEGA